MSRKTLIAALLGIALSTCTAGIAPAGLFAPGPWFGHVWPSGNDTGGIIPYVPEVEGNYREMAASYCAFWHRLSYITSVHRKYGDYITFICIDQPNMIH